ncbi:DUF4372 domain-containing protein [Leadbetterella byssophila]|uniref:DUF4372 domain-containing protein n=1 Tax=Leadbetterella byssophila TaxID=316068 RepID=UPI0039A2EB59
MSEITLFPQIITLIDGSSINKLVKKHSINKHQIGYDSRTHPVVMLFFQFAKSQSVQDIGNALRSATGNLNH